MSKKTFPVFILAISFLLISGCSGNTETSGKADHSVASSQNTKISNKAEGSVVSSESTVSYESDAKKQEMMQLKYNGGGPVFYADKTRETVGKSLRVLLQQEISPNVFKYTAADFGITEASKIKEIKDLGLGEWSYDPYGLGEVSVIRREIEIVLNKPNKDYLLEIAEKVYKQSFVYGVSVDYKEGPYTDVEPSEKGKHKITTLKKAIPDFENTEQAKQYMMQREYIDGRHLYCDYSDNIAGKTLYIKLPRELSLWEFEYTAADFGITDASKIKEIKCSAGYGFYDKTSSLYIQEIEIVLKEKDIDYLIELAKKVYEKPFVASVSLDYYVIMSNDF